MCPQEMLLPEVRLYWLTSRSTPQLHRHNHFDGPPSVLTLESAVHSPKVCPVISFRTVDPLHPRGLRPSLNVSTLYHLTGKLSRGSQKNKRKKIKKKTAEAVLFFAPCAGTFLLQSTGARAPETEGVPPRHAQSITSAGGCQEGFPAARVSTSASSWRTYGELTRSCRSHLTSV